MKFFLEVFATGLITVFVGVALCLLAMLSGFGLFYLGLYCLLH